MASESAPLRVRRYGLESEPYRKLLRDYLAARLSLDLTKPKDAELADAIIRAADARFAYVSFLADRCESGKIAASDFGAGVGLYGLWLQNLDREHGPKQADAIRQVLALLAAAEEAHAWVFGGGRKIDPATGGALSPLPEQFSGLEILLLAQLLDLDRPGAAAYDRVDPGLKLTLQTLQGVIWVSRGGGAGATRFRLALKEFLPAAKADPMVGSMLPLTHARMAAKALDAANLVSEEGWDASGEAGQLFLAVAPLLEAAVHLSGSEPIALRWRPAELISMLALRNDDLETQGHALERVPWLTLIVAWRMQGAVETLTAEQRNEVANSLQNRGIAKAGGGDLAGATPDFDAAIALGQAIRAAMASAWPIPLQNDLAGGLQNRGIAKAGGGDLAGAVADFDAAIALRQVIRAAMASAWPIPLQNNLAMSLQNRGAARRNGGDLAGAIADYDAAIALRQAIRGAMASAWPIPMQNDLAMVLQNRGIAKQKGGDLAGAIADYDAAIALGQAIRAAMANAWPIPLQNNLAMSLQNRGAAKQNGGDLAGAMADYDAAIALRQAIRAAMASAWPIPMQNDLASVLQNRGNAKADGGDLAGAIADYDAAIALGQAIRAAMASAWPIPLQNDLARGLQNRGNAKADGGDLAGATADYDAAIELRRAIRAAMASAWPIPMQNDLAGGLQNRGIAKQNGGDLAGAIADFDAAIELRQAIRAAMASAWPMPLQNGLAMVLYNRALAKLLSHDHAGASADVAVALEIQKPLVSSLGARCQPIYRQVLDAIGQLQGKLSAQTQSAEISSTQSGT
jgi:tetratricopeptide (TPR) repeat protein